MGWPDVWLWIRHGESEGNLRTVDERAAFEEPTHDYALTERGREQGYYTNQWVTKEFGTLDFRYSSNYRRAKETARLIFPDQDVRRDDRLNEAQRGIYHTYTREQIETHFPLEIERREREGLYFHRPFGGENWPDVKLRLHSYFGTIARQHTGQRIADVSHGHVIILRQMLVEHFCVKEALQRYQDVIIPNAAVLVYRGNVVDGEPRLVLEETVVPWEGRL